MAASGGTISQLGANVGYPNGIALNGKGQVAIRTMLKVNFSESDSVLLLSPVQ
jgi:hypothetical protein